jgi:hypothetical protein
MRSSSNERPSSPPRAEETIRGSTSPGPRTQLPTLIGVAPAAPIVTGRPDDAARSSREDALDTVESAVLAPWRPQDAPTVRTQRLPGAARGPRPEELAGIPMRGPKHTFDAISIGDPPTASRRRGRAAAAVVTVIAAIAMILIGKRVSGKGETASGTRAAEAPTAESASKPATVPPLSLPSNDAKLAPGTPSVDVGAANRRPTVPPAKSKHAKTPPRRKHPAPGKSVN